MVSCAISLPDCGSNSLCSSRSIDHDIASAHSFLARSRTDSLDTWTLLRSGLSAVTEWGAIAVRVECNGRGKLLFTSAARQGQALNPFLYSWPSFLTVSTLAIALIQPQVCQQQGALL